MNSKDRFGFNSINNTGPNTNPAALASYTVTNPFLYIAMEKNESVNSALKQKIAGQDGLNILFDYVYANKTAFSASGQQQMQLRFNRANGMTLKRIYYCLTPQDETLNNTFDISNINASKVINFYTMLNNVRRLDFNVSCATADLEDYIVMNDKLKGSVIQNSNMYQYNWVWVENFDSATSISEKHNVNNLQQGLDLNAEQKYDFVASTTSPVVNSVAQGYNHYAFSICQKMLVINSNGIQIL